MDYRYESDQALQEIHDEMYRREEERPKSGLATMDQKTKYFIGIFVGIVVLLMLFNKITVKTGVITLVVGGLIIWFLKGSNPQREELTWIECMLRINDLLTFLQKHPIGKYGQIPPGIIKVRPVGRKQWYEGRGFKRSFAVDIYNSKKNVNSMYFVEVDIFTGDIITFAEAPEGVYGNETKDIKLMPTMDMLLEKKKAQYLDKAYRRG